MSPKPLRKPATDSTPGELRALAKVMGTAGGATASAAVLNGDLSEIARQLASACHRALGRALGQ